MALIDQLDVRNRLLADMKPADFDLLRPHLERVSHGNGNTFATPGSAIDMVCFPEGAVSALLTVRRGARVAIGLVGREGLIGAPLLHGTVAWPYEVVVRAADSSALRIAADRLVQAFRESAGIRDLLLRYAGHFEMQIATTSVSNLAEPLERRMARWILLYHDRLDQDEFPMTHEEFSIMLGVRRASATDILHILEGTCAIRSLRGRVVVRDRGRLEEIAGEAYDPAERLLHHPVAMAG